MLLTQADWAGEAAAGLWEAISGLIPIRVYTSRGLDTAVSSVCTKGPGTRQEEESGRFQLLGGPEGSGKQLVGWSEGTV